jgi:hypothetical protein
MRIRAFVALSTAALTAALVLLPNACTPSGKRARAFQITQRDQLIGGPRALGEVGDWMLENDKIRVIIQDTGFSRGFGVYGGGLIDADLVRHDDQGGDSVGGGGKDNFGEMFTALFLEGMEPVEVPDPNNRGEKLPPIEITSVGDNGVAELTVRAKGSDFLGLTYNINNALLGDDQLLYTTKYRLEPGKSFVEVVTTVQNLLPTEIDLPGSFAGIEIPAPTLDVMLFGDGNEVFVPLEAGFDLRYRLEDIYAGGGFELPAFPGLTPEFLASRGPDVSYGLVGDPEADSGYVHGLSDSYPGAKQHTLLVPFLAQAFTGVFSARPPAVIAGNDGSEGGADEFSWRRFFVIGSGDIASISDTVYDLLGDETGRMTGRVLEDDAAQPAGGSSVVITDADDVAKVTQCDVDNDGRFGANLRPGTYHARVVIDGREPREPKRFTIEAGGTVFVDLRVARQAYISVSVVEDGVGPVPAKALAVGVADEAFSGRDPKTWLYDLSIGEHARFTDLVPDTDDPLTRRYIEADGYTRNGSVRLKVRPGTYTVFVNRGLEYSREEHEVTVGAGETVQVNATVRREVQTPGYIGADFHLHTENSLDSGNYVEDAVNAYAGEGLEFVVPTDHNFVTDLAPVIGAENLEDFLNTSIGLELTTLDRGHFNGWPLEKGDGGIDRTDSENIDTIGSRTYGSFEWALQTPDEIFDALRARGEKLPDGNTSDVIVQVNHPRSPVLGYFDDYGLDQDTLITQDQGLLSPPPDAAPQFAPEVFSFNFDAMEVLNGKSFEELRNFRVPEGLPVDPDLGQPLDPASCCPLTPGEIYFERGAFDCDEEERDCSCTAADAQSQIDAGECEPLGLAFPGNVEDWFQLLNAGKRVVATGNSDSHGGLKEEPGFPRTYVGVERDDPRGVDGQDIVAGFKRGDIMITYGPFITATATSSAGEVGMGGTVDASGGEVTLSVNVQSASWVDVDQVVVYLNGVEVEREDIPESGDLSFTLNPAQDGFIVVEASGDGSLFPSVTPREFPSLQFDDVLDSIGGSFGLGAGGGLQPGLEFFVAAIGFTNPIYVDADGDGEVTPARELPDPAARTARAPVAIEPVKYEKPTVQSIVDAPRTRSLAYRQYLEKHLPRWMWPTDHPRDIRRVFLQFLNHSH